MEIIFIVLFAYLKKLRDQKLKKAVENAASTAKTSLPATLK
jgi:hypothetical protein